MTYPTHTTLTMPTAQAAQIHADLMAKVAPQGERHFDISNYIAEVKNGY